MLVISCINFRKNILHINVFIPILKVAGKSFLLVYYKTIVIFSELNRQIQDLFHVFVNTFEIAGFLLFLIHLQFPFLSFFSLNIGHSYRYA